MEHSEQTSDRHIVVNNLSVWYGQTPAIREVSISFANRGITAIIGPSGCGKSTLLRTINRIADQYEDVRYSGEVLIDGMEMLSRRNGLEQMRSRLGLLLQRPYPLPMSVFDNVAYGPRLQGVRSRERLAEMVEHYLKQAHLWEEVRDTLRKPATDLSIGQQQRLCLARGLAVEPEMMLADEATGSLDPISSGRIEEGLLELKKRMGIVWVTHTLRQARRIADHVAFMYMGRLIEHAAAEQFFSAPRHELTQQYLAGGFS